MDLWERVGNSLKGKLENCCEALKSSMEPGATWKRDIDDVCTLDQLSQHAEATLMQVKGKKVAREKENVEQAGQVFSFRNAHDSFDSHRYVIDS